MSIYGESSTGLGPKAEIKNQGERGEREEGGEEGKDGINGTCTVYISIN